jgi:hypothetical protein
MFRHRQTPAPCALFMAASDDLFWMPILGGPTAIDLPGIGVNMDSSGLRPRPAISLRPTKTTSLFINCGPINP